MNFKHYQIYYQMESQNRTVKKGNLKERFLPNLEEVKIYINISNI